MPQPHFRVVEWRSIDRLWENTWLALLSAERRKVKNTDEEALSPPFNRMNLSLTKGYPAPLAII